MLQKKWIEATNAIGIVSKADLLNAVLLGRTAKQWKDENPVVKGNMRDVATLN